MNVLLKAFLISFLFFSSLFALSIYFEGYISKQNRFDTSLLRSFSKSAPSSIQTTPMPVAQIGNGDANANNQVDFGDVHYISNNWNTSAGGAIDQYKDGKVNSLDFVVVAEHLSK